MSYIIQSSVLRIVILALQFHHIFEHFVNCLEGVSDIHGVEIVHIQPPAHANVILVLSLAVRKGMVVQGS